MKISINIPMDGWRAYDHDLTTNGYEINCEMKGRRKKLLCPHCKSLMKRHSTHKTWIRDLPVCNEPVHICLWCPVGWCHKCRKYITLRPAEVHPSARMTWRMMRFITWLSISCSESMIAAMMKISRSTVHRAIDFMLSYADKAYPIKLDNRRRLIIDEKSIGPHHHYITIVIDGDTGELLYMAKGRAEASLSPFFEKMNVHQRNSVEVVSIDRSNAYKKALEEHLPHAAITFDPFHIVKNAGDALSKVRTQQWHAVPKGEKRFIKSSRCILLKDPKKLNDNEQIRLEKLRELNAPINDAYILKEQLRSIYKTAKDEDEAQPLLELWLQMADESGLKPFVDLAKGMRDVLGHILNFFRYRLSSGKIESLNSRIATLLYKMKGVGNTMSLYLRLRFMTCSDFMTVIPGP